MRHPHRLATLVGSLVIAVGAAACMDDEPATVSMTAEAWPEADKLFHQDPRWLGSDGAYSVPLDDGRILWLFGDTLVATSPANVRSESAFLRNTVGIQRGTDPTNAAMRFYWRRTRDEPSSYFPENGDRWFWPKHGVQLDRTLVIFLSRIKLKPEGDPGFNFEGDGWRVAIVEDASDMPAAWRIRIVTPIHAPPGIVPGEAVNVIGGHVVSLAVGDGFGGYLVRWRVEDLAAGRLEESEWWAGRQGWVSVSELEGLPARVIEKVGPEASLHFDTELDRWVLGWTEGFGAATVVVSLAPRIEGPWSEPMEVYRPPEGDRPGNLIYAGKGHPELDGADLAVTYVASTAYYPRFVNLTFSAP